MVGSWNIRILGSYFSFLYWYPSHTLGKNGAWTTILTQITFSLLTMWTKVSSPMGINTKTLNLYVPTLTKSTGEEPQEVAGRTHVKLPEVAFSFSTSVRVVASLLAWMIAVYICPHGSHWLRHVVFRYLKAARKWKIMLSWWSSSVIHDL